MERITLTKDNLHTTLSRAESVLESGGIVIYPTETMYGVGVDATNQQAVGRLLKYKNRPAGKPISVLVADQVSAETIVQLNEVAKNAYQTFLPGPVTIISQTKGVVDPRLCSELGTLGIRISSHLFAAQLAEEFKRPITATSGNASGKARPYSIETLLSGLSETQKSQIDLIIDAGALPRREPSTVIDTTTPTQEIIRAGEYFLELHDSKASSSEEETITIARQIMHGLLHVLPEKPLVFALEGEMGAGKTHFTKGIAQALQIKDVISSPTYTIMKEYETSDARLLHMDLWRLETVTAEEFGIEEYLKTGTVTVIEWAAPLLPYLRTLKNDIVGYRIYIEPTSEHERTIKIGNL